MPHPARALILATLTLTAAYLAALTLAALAQHPRPAELAVVLGNTITPTGQPSPRLQARLDTAIQLYRSGLVHHILVSGGIEQPGNRDEAAAMAAYLLTQAIPAAAITQDPAGADTLETARHATALAGPDTGVVVVTQWFHLPRAILALRRFGLHDVSGAWPRWFEPRDAYSFLREAVALPVYALKPLTPGR